MDWFTAIVLGIVQGITEWLPISSSGQTAIALVNFLKADPEAAITFGLAVHIVDYPANHAFWPDSADIADPSTWGTAWIED